MIFNAVVGAPEDDLLFRLHMRKLASCECMTLSSTWIVHDKNCMYRLLCEAADELTRLRQEVGLKSLPPY